MAFSSAESNQSEWEDKFQTEAFCEIKEREKEEIPSVDNLCYWKEDTSIFTKPV